MAAESLTTVEIARSSRKQKPDYIRHTLLELLRVLPKLRPGQEICVRVPMLLEPQDPQLFHVLGPVQDISVPQFIARVRCDATGLTFHVPDIRRAG